MLDEKHRYQAIYFWKKQTNKQTNKEKQKSKQKRSWGRPRAWRPNRAAAEWNPLGLANSGVRPRLRSVLGLGGWSSLEPRPFPVGLAGARCARHCAFGRDDQIARVRRANIPMNILGVTLTPGRVCVNVACDTGSCAKMGVRTLKSVLSVLWVCVTCGGVGIHSTIVD